MVDMARRVKTDLVLSAELAGPRESVSPDDDVFVHLARTYSFRHASMRNATPCTQDELQFPDGITNGAAVYPLTGRLTQSPFSLGTSPQPPKHSVPTISNSRDIHAQPSSPPAEEYAPVKVAFKEWRSFRGRQPRLSHKKVLTDGTAAKVSAFLVLLVLSTSFSSRPLTEAWCVAFNNSD